MAKAWPLCHEDGAKYERLCVIKRQVDPGGVVTPNKFSDLLGTISDKGGDAVAAWMGRPGASAWRED